MHVYIHIYVMRYKEDALSLKKSKGGYMEGVREMMLLCYNFKNVKEIILET